MSKQDGTQKTVLQRPTNDDKEGWKIFWKAQGQSWRWEPEIEAKRQKYLDEQRIDSYISGISPFKNVKLNRADVEWLLATHDNGRGPIDWSVEAQRERKGLDLGGADLSGEDLRVLPLAGIIAGFRGSELAVTDEQIEDEKIHLERANLGYAHLEGACLNFAYLEEAKLNEAHLEDASIIFAHLEKVFFYQAHLEGADLLKAYLEHVDFREACLEGANLSYAHLERAVLVSTHLERAFLQSTYLDGTNLSYAHLEGTILYQAHLEGAILFAAFFDSVTRLNEVALSNSKYGGASLVDVHWDDVNVAVIDWSSISELGDERTAKQQKTADGKSKDNATQLDDYRRAVRAYRQLAVVLHNQGLNEDAARFAYRAQMLQRTAFKLQKNFWQFLFSGFLDFLAGYGYRWWRSFRAYLIVILTFATAYFIIGCTVGPALSPIGSLVFSVTSFHGRGFFPGGIKLDDPLTIIAAFEAFIGLLIEVTFIATLTQRLFGK